MNNKLVSIDKMTFLSNVGIDDGYINHPQGKKEYTMELFSTENGYFIEWDLPSMDETIVIGIWHNNKVLTEYDGVYELPKQAIKLLRKNGFTVSKEEFENA